MLIQRKLLLTVLLLVVAQSAIVLDQLNSGLSTVSSKISTLIPDLVQNPVITRPTLSQEADVYFGSTQITIENGDYKKIDFYGTFINDSSSPCAYSRCFYGWINNYTIFGEETVVGYNNQTLLVKPVFQFKTNSEEDFIIVRDPNLDETWVQMIEILCEKINPQITQLNPLSDRSQSTAETQKFDVKAYAVTSDLSQQLATSEKILQPDQESLSPKYSFKTIQASDFLGTQSLNVDLLKIYGASIGDKFSQTSQKVLLEDIKVSDSAVTQTLVLSKDNLVKTRALEYQIKLPSSATISQNGEKVSDFFGNVKINLKHAQKTKVSNLQRQRLSSLLNIKNRASFDYNSITKRRANLADIIQPQFDVVIDQGPSYEQAEVLTFTNQKFTGVNVVDQFKAPNSVLDLNTAVTPNDFARNLQVLQNYTVYNYKKTLFSTTIFGKTFKTQIDVKCYILILSIDHQIQCVGTLNYQLFGNVKSITVFSFKKSVAYAWSWSKQFKGSWAFSVYIPLPPPVSFIGLTFRFSVSYVIDIKLNINAGGLFPYQVKASCLATTKVNTDASAGVRVVVIEGGVFISGTLVEVGTDPTVTLSYYFLKKYINILAQWYFWISAFKYNWGFYYRTWKLFKGWSSRKIIKQWTINGVYGKWVIVNKSWNIYF